MRSFPRNKLLIDYIKFRIVNNDLLIASYDGIELCSLFSPYNILYNTLGSVRKKLYKRIEQKILSKIEWSTQNEDVFKKGHTTLIGKYQYPLQFQCHFKEESLCDRSIKNAKKDIEKQFRKQIKLLFD